MREKAVYTVRRSGARGHVDHGWLDARHTFSFGGFSDPGWMGFRGLRVINDDVIAPRMGFGEHGHRDMEIITYPLEGVVRHRDSLGHEEDILPGMIQHMSAGSGIRHSEFNPLDEPARLLQIWIEPRARGIEPGHRSLSFDLAAGAGRLRLLASPDGAEGSLRIQSDARMLAGVFGGGERVVHRLSDLPGAWVQVVRGSVMLGGCVLGAGDGVAVEGERELVLGFEEESEIIVFELA